MQVCEFRLRTPMHLAQLVEVKGDIKLDSVQVTPGMFGNAFNTPMGFPQMGMSAPFGQPGQASFSFGGVNIGFGIPSVPTPTFSVNLFQFLATLISYLTSVDGRCSTNSIMSNSCGFSYLRSRFYSCQCKTI